MRKMIFATGNENKMVEIREILGDLPLEIQSMKEAGVYADVVEDGSTFEENALIKARAICKLAGQMVLADDSGLEIDYLNKEPGIYSARFGYDPIFYLPERGMTTAQLPPEEKNRISHRGVALRKMKEILEKEEIL